MAIINRRTIQKYLNDLDNHDAVIIHLEPDILECEVKCTLENITTNKASGGDGIPGELFQILIDEAVTVLHSICQQMWKPQQWTQSWKRSVFYSNLQKEAIPNNVQTTAQLHSFHMIARKCSKSFKLGFNSLTWDFNWELPDVQAGFRKDRGTKD